MRRGPYWKGQACERMISQFGKADRVHHEDMGLRLQNSSRVRGGRRCEASDCGGFNRRQNEYDG